MTIFCLAAVSLIDSDVEHQNSSHDRGFEKSTKLNKRYRADTGLSGKSNRACVLISPSAPPHGWVNPGGYACNQNTCRVNNKTEPHSEIDIGPNFTPVCTHTHTHTLHICVNPVLQVPLCHPARHVDIEVLRWDWRYFSSILGSVLTSILRQGCRGAGQLLSLAPLKAQNRAANRANNHQQPNQLLLSAPVQAQTLLGGQRSIKPTGLEDMRRKCVEAKQAHLKLNYPINGDGAACWLSVHTAPKEGKLRSL